MRVIDLASFTVWFLIVLAIAVKWFETEK